MSHTACMRSRPALVGQLTGRKCIAYGVSPWQDNVRIGQVDNSISRIRYMPLVNNHPMWTYKVKRRLTVNSNCEVVVEEVKPNERPATTTELLSTPAFRRQPKPVIEPAGGQGLHRRPGVRPRVASGHFTESPCEPGARCGSL